MRKLFAASLFLGVSAMAASMTGYISDSKCASAHNADKPNEACVKRCVKGGQEAVFVSDGKVYKIAEDSKSKVADHLGHKVKVDGNVEGDTVTIETISMESGS